MFFVPPDSYRAQWHNNCAVRKIKLLATEDKPSNRHEEHSAPYFSYSRGPRIAARGARTKSRHPRRRKNPSHTRSRNHGHPQRDRHPPSAHDGIRNRPQEDRRRQTPLASADADGTGPGTVRDGPRHDGVRSVDGIVGGHDHARHRQQHAGHAHDGHAGAHRRPSAIHGSHGASHSRRLSIDAGRKGRGGSRPRCYTDRMRWAASSIS